MPVKGTVTVNGSAPGTVRFRVGLMPEGSSQKLPNYQGVLGRTQTPAADGTFTVPGVSEGPYRFQALGLTEDLYLDDVKQGGISVFDSGMFVADRAPDLLQFSIRTDGGRLDGTVTGPNSKPAPLATAVLIPNGAQRRNPALYKVATADIAGRFSIRGIRPGTYKIFAWDNVPASAYQNEAFLSKYESQGRAVAITPSSSVSVEVPVISRN